MFGVGISQVFVITQLSKVFVLHPLASCNLSGLLIVTLHLILGVLNVKVGLPVFSNCYEFPALLTQLLDEIMVLFLCAIT